MLQINLLFLDFLRKTDRFLTSYKAIIHLHSLLNYRDKLSRVKHGKPPRLTESSGFHHGHSNSIITFCGSRLLVQNTELWSKAPQFLRATFYIFFYFTGDAR